MILSIIIPIYNVENTIELTLRSLLAQSFNDFEIIIIDDGSTDGSYELVNSILKESHFTNYQIIRQTNQGVSVARNFGIEKAQSKYVYFLDGDDFVVNDFFEKIQKQIEVENDVIIFGYDEVSETNETLSYYFDTYTFPNEKVSGYDALNNVLAHKKIFWLSMCNGIYNRKQLNQYNLRFNETSKTGEDQEFIFKALFHAEHVSFVHNSLVYYVQREGSATKSYSLNHFDAVAAMLRVADYLESHPNSNNVEDALNYLKGDHLINHFIRAYGLSLYYLHQSNRTNIFKNAKFLKNELEKYDADLIIEMKSRLHLSSEYSVVTNLKIMVFKISPILIVWLWQLSKI